MKHRSVSRAFLALVIVSVLACTSAPPKQAYDALGIAAVAVDTGMKIYADLVVAGKIPQATQDIVRKDYGVYQTVMHDAQIAIDAWFKVGAPPALFPSAQVGAALSAAGKIQTETAVK